MSQHQFVTFGPGKPISARKRRRNRLLFAIMTIAAMGVALWL